MDASERNQRDEYPRARFDEKQLAENGIRPGNYHYAAAAAAAALPLSRRRGVEHNAVFNGHTRPPPTSRTHRSLRVCIHTSVQVGEPARAREKPVRDSIYEGRVNIYPVRFLKCSDLQ